MDQVSYTVILKLLYFLKRCFNLAQLIYERIACRYTLWLVATMGWIVMHVTVALWLCVVMCVFEVVCKEAAPWVFGLKTVAHEVCSFVLYMFVVTMALFRPAGPLTWVKTP